MAIAKDVVVGFEQNYGTVMLGALHAFPLNVHASAIQYSPIPLINIYSVAVLDAAFMRSPEG